MIYFWFFVLIWKLGLTDEVSEIENFQSFTLGAILPNNVFMKREYRRALSNVIKEHNQQAFTKIILNQRMNGQPYSTENPLFSHNYFKNNSSEQKNLRKNIEFAKISKELSPRSFKYELRTKEVYVTAWDPEETLNLVCTKLLPAQVSAVLFVSNEAIYTTSAAASTAYLFKCLAVFDIPVIAWNGDNSDIFQNSPATSNVIQLAPTIKHQVAALISILDRYSWDNFVIITTQIVGNQDLFQYIRSFVYDPDINYNRKFKIIKSITLNSMQEEYLNAQLSSSALLTARIFILHATREESVKIFRAANHLNMTGQDYMWIITQQAIGNLQDYSDFDKNKVAPNRWSTNNRLIKLTGKLFADSGGVFYDENKYIFNFSPKRQDYPVGLFCVHFETGPESMIEQIEIGATVYVQAMHNFLTNAANKMKDLKALKPNLSCYHGELTQDSFFHNGLVLLEYLKNVNTNFGGTTKKIISFDEDGSLKSVNLNILNLNMEHQWIKIGVWNEEDGLKIKDIIWPGAAHLPPKGIPEQFHIRVAASEEPPFINIMERGGGTAVGKEDTQQHGTACSGGVLCSQLSSNETIDGSNSQLGNCCSGYFIDIMEKLAQDLGFTYDLAYITEENALGSKRSKSDFLVEELIAQRVEMVIGLTITSDKSNIIEFSNPFLETGIAIAVSLRTGSISPIAFLEPFDYITWILILLICIHAAAISIFLYEYISPMGFNMKKQGYSKDGTFSVFRSIWLAWAILFGASVQVDVPKSHTSRFLITIWSMVAMVFIASYTANLAAFMISKEDHYDFSGIHDIRLRNPYIKEPPYIYGTVLYSSSASNIKFNYPQMYQYMRNHNRSNVKEGIIALKNGTLDAFIYDGRVLEYMVGRDDQCKLLTVGSWFAMTGYSIAFVKDSELRPLVDNMLMKYQENGDMDRLQHFWLAGDCKLKKNHNDSSHPLGLMNFISAFVLLGAGIVLSLLFLGLEHIYFKFLRKHIRKIDKKGLCSLISVNMGRTLSFEKTVLEIRNTFIGDKCKNIMCKTNIWKLKEELAIANLKIRQLESVIEEYKKSNGKSLPCLNKRSFNGFEYLEVETEATIRELETSL